eukprot:jgi/Botrbrau1/13384/Bobra.0194s0015.1
MRNMLSFQHANLLTREISFKGNLRHLHIHSLSHSKHIPPPCPPVTVKKRKSFKVPWVRSARLESSLDPWHELYTQRTSSRNPLACQEQGWKPLRKSLPWPTAGMEEP